MHEKQRPFQNVTRILAFIIVILVSVIVIYLTPFPDLNAPEVSCDRPCHELEWPRICRFTFVLESHLLLPKRCDANDDQCTKVGLEENYAQNLLTVNRQISGPAIHVCHHDTLLVDVINKIPHKEATIHWRGLSQRKSPLMDGVSMITQCPIVSQTAFQYKFRASEAGTHLWHLHDQNNEKLNFVKGLLVVRQSIRQEPQNSLVDIDSSNNSLILRTIERRNFPFILINGNLKEDEMTVLNVTRGKRYRFRLAHSGGSVHCPIRCWIDDHTILVIALDGNPVQPINTTHITFVSGERVDFVLHANRPLNKYSIHFALERCDNGAARKDAQIIYQPALCNGNEQIKPSKMDPTPNNHGSFPLQLPFTTVHSEKCAHEVTCLQNVKSKLKVSSQINDVGSATLPLLQTYNFIFGRRPRILPHLPDVFVVGHINNITHVNPSSPLTSQFSDVSSEQLCFNSYCKQPLGCECTHIIQVSLGQTIQIKLIDEDPYNYDHIFHLHGNKFHVISVQTSNNKLKPSSSPLNQLEQPVAKDTLLIPKNGSAVIRFVADYPGYWLLEEESRGLEGMKLVFKVDGAAGSSFEIPENFPKCGDWVGPKYFLA